MTDQLKKYLFPDQSVRVQAARLDEAWQAGLAHQSYPACLQRLLGELAAASVLLASNIKFQGSLVLQLQGDGPVALIVVECSADLSIRATATLREGREVPADGTLQSLLNTGGQGRFVVVLDPGRERPQAQPYQGVVPLGGDTVAEVLELYMRNSEQLDTRLWLAADAQRCAGLLVQRMPGQDDAQGEALDSTWERACHLAATIQADELLSLDTDTLIHRLFWDESLTELEPRGIRWHCPCTRERVADMLRMLGRAEVDGLLAERGQVDVACNFCGKPYHFDAVDCAGLFRPALDTPAGDSKSVH
ncbi:Hsp33 family molecular chaperone HslO [Candidimonas humi]|jgi:molecular chaperone Hsp33|uniref:Hsp33 family molecular chaperone HslO n=1 Tax=Candidimonas humi TaxID=683355 RepID=A0ABV8NWL8_9BURK|nr:Hsp33 family molecular chaperone HslO [Candidimonas humi]MBV6305283.1 Hsp33 family molecular chaperone HslO [Candidimonas humi]